MIKIEKLVPKGLKVTLEPGKHATLNLKASHTIDANVVKRAVAAMLTGLGIDRTEENFKETPERVTKMWTTWLQPQSLKLAVFESIGGSMVTLVDHRTVSMCPHHMLPVELLVNMAYIPQNYVVGISKLARLADFASSSFMLQEHISEFVAELLEALLQPKGAAVAVAGTHGCMRMRGIRSPGWVVTTALRGVYLTDEKARAEFYESTRVHSPVNGGP